VTVGLDGARPRSGSDSKRLRDDRHTFARDEIALGAWGPGTRVHLLIRDTAASSKWDGCWCRCFATPSDFS